MSPGAQRIAIAKTCGMNPSRFTENDITGLCEMDETGALCVAIIPDYLNDLNAMHEAERVLQSSQQWDRYTSELGYICGFKPGIHDSVSFRNIIVSATATQRAEAFLRTLGLWK